MDEHENFRDAMMELAAKRISDDENMIEDLKGRLEKLSNTLLMAILEASGCVVPLGELEVV